MKTLVIVLIVVIIGLITWSILSKPKIIEPSPSDTSIGNDMSGVYTIDTASSTTSWVGSKKIILNYYDKGNINIKSGTITINKGVIASGAITFDMNSISTESTGTNGGQDNLTKHLKSADFFDVTKYPEATFILSSVQSSTSTPNTILVGNLTMKGKTAPLSIPVTAEMDGDSIVLRGIAEVDRTIWEVKYGSKKFFDKLGDNVINDTFTLQFEVVAKK